MLQPLPFFESCWNSLYTVVSYPIAYLSALSELQDRLLEIFLSVLYHDCYFSMSLTVHVIFLCYKEIFYI